jgi:superfamily II DNA or RNA helicase
MVVDRGHSVALPLAEQTAAAFAVEVPMARSGGGTTVSLRDYQLEAIEAVTVAWRDGAQAPLIVLPTASGKTIISAEIMARAYVGSGGKSLFIAHREELLMQTMDKVRLVSPTTRVGLVQQMVDEMGREITVASIQTIGHASQKRLKALIEKGPYQVVVIDEAHHAVGAQYTKVIAALRAANPAMLLMGMTATPGRADGIALDRVFDVVAYEKNTFEMIRDGWLVPPHGFQVQIDIDLDKVDVGDGDYVVTQLSKMMNTPPVNRAVVEAWRAHGHDRKCIVFAVDIAHAHALAQEFNDAGHPAAAIDGKMKKKDRHEVLNRFREGSIKLLVNCNVLTEGYDDPSAEGIVFARPTQSQALYIQCLDYQTEILTKRGWVGPRAVRDDDIVATMDPETERCVWSPVLSRVDRPMHEREKMYALALPGLDVRVTGNHRMVYKQRRDGKPLWTVASQLPKSFTAIVSVEEPKGTDDCQSITDDELAFLGWWYAEGSWNRANNTLVIYQGSGSPFANQIEFVLRQCGFKFGRQRRKYDTKFKKNHEMFSWYVSHGAPRGTQKRRRGWEGLDRWINRDGTKKPTDAFHELSARQWGIFLRAFNYGDGARYNSPSIDWDPKTWTIGQKAGTGLHDVFQALCVTRGVRCNLSGHKMLIAPGKRYHTVNGSRPELTMREVPRSPDERVWCVETSTGTIITRRNGKVAVVGNCLGRGLRLYPGKTECLVIDCVGNGAKHQPVQLASLVGFDPERKYSGGLKGFKDAEDIVEEEEVDEVTGAKIGGATEIKFNARKPKSNYQWRETSLGWILQIPRIGYYLVAWSDKARHMATIRFFDQRTGRKHQPPREVVRQPIEFDMAYGLVESEMDRIFRARANRRDDGTPDQDQPQLASFIDLDEGVDETVALPEEELMLKDASWRERSVSPKQRELLLALGVKEKTMPNTTGEASDLITIMRVERDMKMRMPATLKQLNYLRYNKLPIGEQLTKGQAAKAIWTHRKATTL